MATSPIRIAAAATLLGLLAATAAAAPPMAITEWMYAGSSRLVVSTVELPASTWTGVYFQSVPVPIRGEASPGFRFAGFEEIDGEPDGEGLLWWTPDSAAATLTARFLRSADLDGDGLVGGGDLALLLAAWGKGG